MYIRCPIIKLRHTRCVNDTPVKSQGVDKYMHGRAPAKSSSLYTVILDLNMFVFRCNCNTTKQSLIPMQNMTKNNGNGDNSTTLW